MDVGSNPAQLKRCSSAPMINDLDQGPLQPPPTPPVAPLPRSSPTLLLFSSAQPRTRRFSATFSPLNSPACPSGSSSPVPTRVSQLKQEEGADPVGIGRELAREKELQSTLQLSQSWEDLTLTDTVDNKPEVRRPASACTDPLQLTLPNAFAAFSNSPHPSPTRVVSTRQCFSPSMQIPVRNASYSPTPSPSPTRKAFLTRSLSPITMRPSTFGAVKRKCDLDSDKELNLGPPTKRPPQLFASLSNDKSNGFLLTRAVTPTSLDLAGSVGSVGTPESCYSTGGDSPAALSPLHMDTSIPSTSSAATSQGTLPLVVAGGGASCSTTRQMGVSPLPFHSLALSSRACSSTSCSGSTSGSSSPRPAEGLKEFMGVGEEEELVTLLKDSTASAALIPPSLGTTAADGGGRACDFAKKFELMEAESSDTSDAIHIDASQP